MATLTAHCIVKNEENFVGQAIRSVIDYVDKIIVFDTGSIDRTVAAVKNLAAEYPDKIYFEEKGSCDKVRHTQLRQEMIDRTQTDWFMILDGDEVWTSRGMAEAVGLINERRSDIDCLIAPFFLCVGDVYHYSTRGRFEIFGRKIHATPRFFKLSARPHWSGEYGNDTLHDPDGSQFIRADSSLFLQNKFWHLTHLMRSSAVSDEFTSGGTRKEKKRSTYFLIGRKIHDDLPEAFDQGKIAKLSFMDSLTNFFIWIISRLTKNSGR